MHNAKVLLIGSTILFIHGCQMWPSQFGELPPPAALPATSEPGKVQFRIWTGITGSDVSDLTSIDAYPDNPNTTKELTSLDNPGGLGNYYGSLVRGYIEPPTNGEYTFYVSGDDETQFLFSTNESPSNAEIIASVPNYTTPYNYTKYSSQTSGTQVLEGGKRYYFEIRHKQGSGGEHFAVAWSGPGISQEVISGDYLYSEGQSGNYENQSSAEAYTLGYRVGYFDSTQGLSFNPEFPPLDNDSDGLYDNWETVNGLDPSNSNDADTDPDGDFLTAADEFLIGTKENNADTDGDGIPDGQEFAYNLDPLNGSDAARDADGDGYSNLQEYQAGTDPNNSDEAPVEETPTSATVSGFVGQYFEGTDFNNFVGYRVDGTIDFDWGRNAPMNGVPSDAFSIRWTGQFTAPHSSGARDYQFVARTNDGVRVYLNGEKVIEDWSGHSATTYTYTRSISAGETVPITMEYYEGTGSAVAQLNIVDTTNNSDVAITQTVTAPDPTASGDQDSDSDGIPDSWEVAHGLNAWVNDASAVSNTSGVSNLDAYQSDLDPWTLESTSAGTGGGSTEPEPTQPPTTTGNVTLSWTAPSTRLDGSSIALSEIDHYVINYGQESGNLGQTQNVDAGTTSYTFDGLASGTWYFTVQTVDSSDRISPPSEEVSQEVQ
ncbi:hypothetical protein EB809_13955 [Marinobacter sp. R17]|uniref:PA14 domain-containing protein n=1 Tax=Marinobacter sp. R17 TaxID=2484250 RepID=UPI000F4B08AA|nr:PA14 domain-containing protein [Marinobacter sp. R17]ROT98400.1 hypothetical protein EB809_13955 [Marinobacter sp. R17]